MIVSAGILTAEGKLEQLSVKKSPVIIRWRLGHLICGKKMPGPQANSLLTDVLGNWTFQRSQIDGRAE